MRRIRWSCEGLTSVHNEYTWYTLKHLLLRHMYNLPLPVLLCYAQALCSETSCCYDCASKSASEWVCPCTVLCGALYTACVDARRTVFWDCSIWLRREKGWTSHSPDFIWSNYHTHTLNSPGSELPFVELHGDIRIRINCWIAILKLQLN